MKYVSMRIPDSGPFGETFRDASVLAMVAASFVNRPAGGCVESVLTVATQRGVVRLCRSLKTDGALLHDAGVRAPLS